MIDFSATAQAADTIEYYNLKGEVVKTYQLSELEKFVTDNRLNISYRHDAEGGTGMVCDPNTDFNEVEVHELLSEYIDNNWLEVTEKFYIANNESAFKSANREQQTRKALAC